MRPDRKGDTFASNPRLADELRARDVGTIVAFGIQSECCVLSTSLGALIEEFEVTLMCGAHSTYDTEGKAAVEDALKGEGARTLDWNAWEP
jgi:nicotinamidase-related amidase